jgi:hypothetical protein
MLEPMLQIWAPVYRFGSPYQLDPVSGESVLVADVILVKN